MSNSGLTVLAGDLLGIPKISISGYVDRVHEHAILGILNGYRDYGARSIVLDLVGIEAGGAHCASFVLWALRGIGPSMCVHVVGSSILCGILNRAGMGPRVRAYASLDEIVEASAIEEEYMTSRWMASDSDDSEMPLAA